MLTLMVFAIIQFLNTRSALLNDIRSILDALLYSWSTLLLPTLVQWPVTLFGTELNLGSMAFETMLNGDLPILSANGGM